MLQLTSSRLPGVSLLEVRYTGPEYARWRRSLKFALEAKGSWKYCNGNCTMPMPEAGATSPTGSTANLQPTLLEERREWVKHDREVKLDLFLSLAEEVMFEVFEVGSLLPPSNMNAQEMLQTIDEHFQVFKFEAYHHAFCHFLNLHIDQFPSIEDFNQEYLNAMEDLLDHGHPLSNTQACSAYFSKLRCTQNPWVAQKLAEWDVQTTEVDCVELVKESPPWSVIRPLAVKSSQSFRVESIPEQYLEDSSASDSDLPSDRSDASTVSSISVHSHDEILDTKLSKELIPQRQESVITTRSQEITIRASVEDIAELQQPQDLRKELENLPSSATPERGSLKEKVPGSLLRDEPDATLIECLVSRKSLAQKPPPPHDRPLPPLPVQAQQPNDSQSSPPPISASKNSSQTSLSTLKLETTHPTLRPTAPLELHPALRAPTTTTLSTASKATPTSIPAPQLLPSIDTTPLSFPFSSNTSTDSLPQLATPPTPAPTTSTPTRRPSTSSPNLAIPWPSTPSLPPRPASSLTAPPTHQAPHALAQVQPAPPAQLRNSPTSQKSLNVSPSSSSSSDEDDDDNDDDDNDNKNPFQTPHDSAWTYLYESKGGYLIPRHHRRATSFPAQTSFSTSLTARDASVSALRGTCAGVQDFVARMGGGGGGGGVGAQHLHLDHLDHHHHHQQKKKKKEKTKSWSSGRVNLARFSVGKKGVDFI